MFLTVNLVYGTVTTNNLYASFPQNNWERFAGFLTEVLDNPKAEILSSGALHFVFDEEDGICMEELVAKYLIQNI